MNDDDDLLSDLNFDDQTGGQEPFSDSGRSLPKKVELDIDDLALEEEEEELEELEEEEPDILDLEEEEELEGEIEEEEEPEAKPKTRLARKKLILLALLVLVPLLAAGAAAIFFFGIEEKVKRTKPHVVEIRDRDLKPFVINFPGQTPRVIVLLQISLTFPYKEIEQEFDKKVIIARDLIYRYVQGQGPKLFDDSEAGPKLEAEFARLINKALEKGKVEQVQIKKIKKM